MAAIPPMRMKSTFALANGGMTWARSTLIALSCELFAGPPQLFDHLQNAQMFLRTLLESEFQVFPQQSAINFAHVDIDLCGVAFHRNQIYHVHAIGKRIGRFTKRCEAEFRNYEIAQETRKPGIGSTTQ